jgi:hypothetical protein
VYKLYTIAGAFRLSRPNARSAQAYYFYSSHYSY